jgi:hypothetical protein
VRYCWPCSTAAGVLVERTAPALERERATAAERNQAKAAAKRHRASVERARARQRETGRYTVAGVDLRDELARYAKLPIFRGTRLARELPTFTVRRSRTRGSRLGFAEPWHWRIHLSLLVDQQNLAQARRTLIHELVHLHVGQVGKEWHGVRFRMALNRAMAEAGLGADGAKLDLDDQVAS